MESNVRYRKETIPRHSVERQPPFRIRDQQPPPKGAFLTANVQKEQEKRRQGLANLRSSDRKRTGHHLTGQRLPSHWYRRPLTPRPTS